MITKATKRNLLQVFLQVTTDYQIRTEEARDTTYWVVPVVMMVEGVHYGSKGPLLYTQEELSATVNAWDGMPVTIGHPQDAKGKYISANSPSVLKGIVGRVFNAKMKGDKLIAEAWIDINSLTQLSSEALEYIKEKKALEVSVGVFSMEEGEEGEFSGEVYRAAAVNLVPDHLALLPGEKGACSWEDGCGIRNNFKNMKKDKITIIDKASCLQAFLETNQGMHLIENKASLNHIVSGVYDKLNAMDTDGTSHYLEEVFDNYVVYSVVNRNSKDRRMYKQEYSITTDEKIEFTGEMSEVRKKVSYVGTELKRTNFNNKLKITMNKKPCTCTVDSLISNEATSFNEDDRDWLTALAPEQLEKLAPKEATEEQVKVVNKKTTTPVEKVEKNEDSLVSKDDKGNISINGKSIGDYVKEELGKETDPNKFIDNFMPEGLKNQMKSGLSMYQGKREAQIKAIVANSKFKADQLKKWSDEDLTSLHESLVDEDGATGNYVALGSSHQQSEGDDNVEEITAMLGLAPKVETAKEAVK